MFRNKLTIISIATFFGVLTGCASTTAQYKMVGSTDVDLCDEMNCLIDTDTGGKALLSIGEVSATTISPVVMEASQDASARNTYFDYLVTVTNTSENPIVLDPEKIPGYEPEAIVSELKSSKNFSVAMGAALLLAGAVAGGSEGVAMALSDPTVMKLVESADLDSEKINQAETEFQDEKLLEQVIQPNEVAAGRIILRSDIVATDTDSTIQEVVRVMIPVGSDIHDFAFKKELQEN